VWDSSAIAFELDESATEAPVVTLIARTPAGELHVMAELVAFGPQRVEVRGAHTFGPAAHALGIRGLRAVARAFVEQFDVEELVVAGAARTTGANPGHTPPPFRYRRRRGTG
jgi:hypothetical protein